MPSPNDSSPPRSTRSRTPLAIAIVGRACTLPGALSPDELWRGVESGRDWLSEAPPGRWVAPDSGLDAASFLCAPDAPSADHTWSNRGGYVRGFEQLFDPAGFLVPADFVLALDPLFQWTLHTARAALRDAGIETGSQRVGAVLGNLSFPSAAMARYAESIWRGEKPTVDPHNRFSSGLPALVLQRALGLEAGAFALDAACASSLYAIKSASDWLDEGRADVVLAGAVNCTDDLFIHIGFSALSALSRSGQSRPFNARADGLIPAEGAAFVALKRLEDAERDGDTIHGVIRGIGLSNDGRGRGFLVPSSEGQVRAMRAAYEQSGLEPGQIELIECHATGTAVGDATELRSLIEVFGDRGQGEAASGSVPGVRIPLGSLKSNLGHLITAAGAAGLIKVTEAMRAGIKPPTLHVDEPLSDFEQSGFRPLLEAEPWTLSGQPRRAAISAFGFGGNNAHLIVEQWQPKEPPGETCTAAIRVTTNDASASRTRRDPPAQIAVTGIGVVASGCRDLRQFTQTLLSGASRVVPSPPLEGRREDGQLAGRIDRFEVELSEVGIPPNDLRVTLAQQLLLLDAGCQAAAEAGDLDRERTGVFVGMGVDGEVARYGARWRLGEWLGEKLLERQGDGPGRDGIPADEIPDSIRDGVVSPLVSSGVIGTMPNIVANRLNRRLDLAGPSCTVSAEERSGLEALDLAVRALRAGELDSALVGAVDLSCEPVQRAAAEQCLPSSRQIPGDAAVALVVKRLEDAERDGDRIYATIEPLRFDSDTSKANESSLPEGESEWGPDAGQISLNLRFGHAHAASGLLHLAAAALSVYQRVHADGSPWLGRGLSREPRRAVVRVSPMGVGTETQEPSSPRPASRTDWRVVQQPRSRSTGTVTPSLFHCFEGRDRSAVLEALTAERRSPLPAPSLEPGAPANARLVIVAGDRETLDRRVERARRHLETGAPAGAGVHYREAPVRGDVGFVFASAGTGYIGMGEDLLRALPDLGDRLDERFGDLEPSLSWALSREITNGKPGPGRSPSNTERLWGASAICRLHSELTLHLLGITPSAAIGYSSGESTSLFALGAWSDIGAMRDDIEHYGLFDPALGGRFEAVASAWGSDQPVDWSVWNVLADADEVRSRLDEEPRLHLAIVHNQKNCVIAGDSQAALRLVEAIGAQRCQKLDYDIAAHVPEVEAFREQWLAIHRRPVTAVPGVRFYSAGHRGAYEPSTEACAQAILRQAVTTLDFPAVIEAAYDDGVRVFIEHGPQASCSGWIREILGERLERCVVVALDRSATTNEHGPQKRTRAPGELAAPDDDLQHNGVAPVLDAVAALLAAGLDIDPRPMERALSDGLGRASGKPLTSQRERETTQGTEATETSEPKPVVLAAHPAPVRLPLPDEELMVPAPALPSVLDEKGLPETTGSWLPELEPQPTASLSRAAARAEESVPEERSPVLHTVDFPSRLPELIASQKQAWQAQLDTLRQVHQQFLQHQARVHERFLATRHPSLAAAGARTAVATPAPVAVEPPARGPRLAAVPATPVAPPARPERLAERPSERPGEAPLATPEEVATETVESPSSGHSPVGLTLDRRGLEIHASGNISEIFGPLFAEQDRYSRQVRMPEPPLLLAERMTGIDARPGVHGTGTIWTETDVREDSWYLHRGRMPAGILIESGQADLMLISFMGADLINRSERVYRLLGCELTFLDDLPRPGETLCYEIKVDGHAEQDGIRLFFFHYDCTVAGKPRIQVRSGQAGFFTDAELARSAGVLWSAEESEPCAEPRLDPPVATPTRRSFDAAQIQSFAEGRPWDCFGDDFELAKTHTQTPTIQTGDMLFLDRITDFDPIAGGPWGRGYLHAEADVSPDDWFFAGHFKNDPCMPGTLMFEGCVQALAFTMAGMGFTLRHDGWRFQPVTGEAIEMRCRGQVTPTSRKLSYEVFVEEVVAGPIPTLYADLLCTVDGLKAFHAKRVGLQLVPDWPLESTPEILERKLAEAARHPGANRSLEVARVPLEGGGSFELGYPSLLACAWGRPSSAFGPLYRRFDGPTRVPRLPGPPYHFVSRILEVTGEIGGMQNGSTVEVEYDVPPDAWYFDENGERTMPYAVLLEAALQPCGWLASYIGSALTVEEELAFRNLDGTGTLFEEILDGTAADSPNTLRTKVVLDNISRSAGMIIVGFEVECFLDQRRVYEMKTVFGFFPPQALANQVGQPTTDEQRTQLSEKSDFQVDLKARPDRFFAGTLRLGERKLRMIDRVTGYWPQGGAAGLGRARAERDIDAGDWYFKAHFFQDPVQPGSLGIEAMIQLLQFTMIEADLAKNIERPRFEPLALGHALTWKYRGQVVPSNERITVTIEITEIIDEGSSVTALATSSLWCDGIRIYSAQNLGMRIVSGAPASAQCESGPSESLLAPVDRLDPTTDTWLLDHCPTFSRPALPMMSVIDLLARAVPADQPVVAIRDVQVKGWLDFSGPRGFRTEVTRGEETESSVQWQVELYSRDLSQTQGSGGSDRSEQKAASARVFTGRYTEPPPTLEALAGEPLADPYASGHLFHGPAFQRLLSGSLSESGASTRLSASSLTEPGVPIGRLNPALLDAALHGIPHDRLSLWAEEIATDRVAYPTRVTRLELFGETPSTGEVRCEVRFDGFLMAPDLPRFRVQLITREPEVGERERVWAEMTLVEACFPKGPLGSAEAADRRRFLRDHVYVEGVSLSRHEAIEPAGGATTILDRRDVEQSDWMPGTIEAIYGTRDSELIAIKEHLAARHRLHPRILPQALPLERIDVAVRDDGDLVVVEQGSNQGLDLTPVTRYWQRRLGFSQPWLGQDLIEGLIERYLSRVVLEDPAGFAELHGRSAIFIGNHQVQIESILITHLLGGLTGLDVVTMANAKHEARWIGWLIERLASYPALGDHVEPFEPIVYFDQSQPSAMFDILAELEPRLRNDRCSFFFHAAGTRSRFAPDPVTRISSVFLDLAVDNDLPLVPIEFNGGLTAEPTEGKLEFPIEHAKQEYVIGRAIEAEELRALPYVERRGYVLDAMNRLAGWPPLPHLPDRNFEGRVKAVSEHSGVGEVEATLLCTLEQLDDPSLETRRLLAARESGELDFGDDEHERWLAEVARRLLGG